MTTDEKLDLIMDTLGKMNGPVTVGHLVGPNGNAILPNPPPIKSAFDWSGLWKQIGPLVLLIVNTAILSLAAYVGIDTRQVAQSASNHAETAAVQSKANGEALKVQMMYGAHKEP